MFKLSVSENTNSKNSRKANNDGITELFEERIENVFKIKNMNNEEDSENQVVEEFKNSFNIKQKNLELMKDTLNNTNLQGKILGNSNLSTENFEKHISHVGLNVEKGKEELANKMPIQESDRANNLSNLSSNSKVSTDSRMNRAKSALREASDALKKFKGKKNNAELLDRSDDSMVVREIQELMQNDIDAPENSQ